MGFPETAQEALPNQFRVPESVRVEGFARFLPPRRWKAPIFEEAPKLPGGKEIRKSPIARSKMLPQGGFSERRKELLPSGPVLLKKKVER